MSPRQSHLAAVVTDADTMTECLVDSGTPEWAALIAWLEWHGIDPHQILAGTRVTRDAAARCIHYRRVVTAVDGKWLPFPDPDHPGELQVVDVPAVEQGEAPPLPFPDVVARWLR